jgi:anti-sigma factor RsiW
MDCVEVADRLLVDEPERDAELERHVGDCARCAHLARGLRRLDVVLSSVVVVQPPRDLQLRLAQLALEAARPQTVPWWRRLGELTNWLTQRPQMVAAQGLAMVMLALASWQIFGWLSAFQVGDVAYAIELVAGSPAVAYLGSIQIDFQSLGLWSLVGVIGWLVSENGVIGRRIASSGRPLP